MTESWLFKGKKAKALEEADEAASHEEPGHRIPSDDEGVNGTTRFRPRRQHTLKEKLGDSVDAFLAKDWGTATPQGSTMPATGLQDTNLGPGQKKRCATCGKVKCKCQ